jgi:hypothetical protein
MEAAGSSETLVNFYQTTRRYNPEDSHLSNNIWLRLQDMGHLIMTFFAAFCHFIPFVSTCGKTTAGGLELDRE